MNSECILQSKSNSFAFYCHAFVRCQHLDNDFDRRHITLQLNCNKNGKSVEIYGPIPNDLDFQPFRLKKNKDRSAKANTSNLFAYLIYGLCFLFLVYHRFYLSLNYYKHSSVLVMACVILSNV